MYGEIEKLRKDMYEENKALREEIYKLDKKFTILLLIIIFLIIFLNQGTMELLLKVLGILK